MAINKQREAELLKDINTVRKEPRLKRTHCHKGFFIAQIDLFQYIKIQIDSEVVKAKESG